MDRRKYGEYINSLCQDECPEIAKLGREAKERTFELDGYTFAKSSSVEDIAKATEDYYGVPACSNFNCHEDDLAETMEDWIKTGWMSIIVPEWESGRPYVIGCWNDV